MFESAELGHRISKEDYKARLPEMRALLVEAQYEMAERADFPCTVVFAGMPGGGKGETVNTLTEWMDPRLIHAHSFSGHPSGAADQPTFWPYWRSLPAAGRTAVFLESWYTPAKLQHAKGLIDDAALAQRIEEIRRFESMLVAEGAVLLKFWFHLTQRAQRELFKALEKDKHERWRVTKDDWAWHERYDDLRRTAGRLVRRTEQPDAPWVLVEAMDERYRHLTVGEAMLSALRYRLDQPKPKIVPPAPLPVRHADTVDVIGAMDLGLSVDKQSYQDRFRPLQAKLARLSRKRSFRSRSMVLVFEGNDAAGKGGAIRRVTRCLDARFYRVVRIGAPTDEERARPYLWRFWRHLPPNGHSTLFDRSWYGRVLVERIEGFADEVDWRRAYGEINDFEDQLIRNGTVVGKFWLAIDKDEQLRRFEARAASRFKRFKLTEEDWRNREKWDDYHRAAVDMIEHTSTGACPWTLVESNSKYHARLKVLETVIDRLEAAL